MTPLWRKSNRYDVATIAAALLLLLSTASLAQRPARYAPASLGEGEQSLFALVRTPFERPSGNYDVTLKCQVIVEPDGSTRLPRCLVIEHYDAFRLEAERALAAAIMTPARIRGEPVRVLMNLAIGYRCAVTCPAFLFTNHGGNVREFGFSYSAPQPVLDDDAWYQGFDEKMIWAGSELSPAEVGGVGFVVAAQIHESGRTSNRRVEADYSEGADNSYETLAESAADSLRDARYIPGFYRGEAVEMRLYEYWLNPDGVPLEILSVPLRVHILWSDLVPALDSTVTDEQVREMVVTANELWQPAAIHWQLESIVHTQAERQLGFRSTVIDDPTGRGEGASDTFSRICPVEDWLSPGWNVCWVRAVPRGALYLNSQGGALLGEEDVLGGAVPPFALGHVLGHLMGLLDAQECAGTFMRWFEGAGAGSSCNNPMPTDLSDIQIQRARVQARIGSPYRAGGRRGGMGRRSNFFNIQ